MLPALESEQQLRAIEAASFGHPHLDVQAARKIVGRHMGRVRAASGESSGPKSTEDMLAALAASGFPIRVVPQTARARRGTRRDTTKDGIKTAGGK